MKVAAVSFIVAKVVFVGTAFCMLIGDLATIISMSLYISLVVLSVVLSLWEGFTKRKKSYGQLEEENRMLKKTLDTMT